MNGSCSKCGACAKKCPVNAIDPASPDKTDKSKCIACLQCVASCPCHARYINKVILGAADIMMKKLCGGRKENAFFIEEACI